MKAVKIASDNFDRSFALAVSMATGSVFGEWSVSGENLTRLGVELSEVLGMKPVHIPHPSRRTISISQFGLQSLLSCVIHPVRQCLLHVFRLPIWERRCK